MDIKTDEKYQEWETDLQFALAYDHYGISGKRQWVVIAHTGSDLVISTIETLNIECSFNGLWNSLKEKTGKDGIWMAVGHPDEAMVEVMRMVREYYTGTLLQKPQLK